MKIDFRAPTHKGLVFFFVFEHDKIMEKIKVWSEDSLVRFGDIDQSDTMTLNSIFTVFQDAAISHAVVMGVARETLAQSKQVWIISRMSVQVDRRPKFGESIKVRSWPRETEKFFVLRDCDIRDADDQAAVRARSYWLIFDTERRRPLRPQAIIDGFPSNEGMDALPSAPGLMECPLLQKKNERRALYSDLDFNGHVNNISYIRWIEDALESGLLEQAKQMRLDINYLNEVLPNETIEIWMAEIDSTATDAPRPLYTFAFEGKKAKNNQAAFRAELRLW